MRRHGWLGVPETRSEATGRERASGGFASNGSRVGRAEGRCGEMESWGYEVRCVETAPAAPG